MIRRQPKWSKKLSRPLVLTGGPGGQLVTLEDAANVLRAHFNDGRQSGLVGRAARLVSNAAEDGSSADIEVVTGQVARVLRSRLWM